MMKHYIISLFLALIIFQVESGFIARKNSCKWKDYDMSAQDEIKYNHNRDTNDGFLVRLPVKPTFTVPGFVKCVLPRSGTLWYNNHCIICWCESCSEDIQIGVLKFKCDKYLNTCGEKNNAAAEQKLRRNNLLGPNNFALIALIIIIGIVTIPLIIFFICRCC